ncbi:MAG: sialate O-acetylesterase [Bacteroidales bacterium]|nr:sialate O-acetylesterase [Bacteroidales bacterium]
MKTRILFFSALILMAIESAVSQKITMPRILNDNMVLQQNTQVKIWGWATQGTAVAVTASWGQTVNCTSDATGNWVASLNTPVAVAGQAPKYSISVVGPSNTLTFSNILVGEVWLCTGQSNMWLPMGTYQSYLYRVFNQAEIDAANYPNIRLFMVDYKAYKLSPATSAQTDLPRGTWKECNPASVDSFSIIPYFFARELYKNPSLNVPIGVVSVAWGGKPIADFLMGGAIYNTYIAPLVPFAVKGVLWYQGEADYRGNTYASLQTALVNNWRKTKGTNFPFYAVQLAPYIRTTDPANDLYYVLPLFREFQNTLLNLPNTGIVVNTDLTLDSADTYNIHPPRKLEVGKRLAALALAKDYGQNVQYQGPVFQSMAIEGNAIRISFVPATIGTGLNTRNGKIPATFRIAGSDNKFYPAYAQIDGNTVLVSSDYVTNPTNVRYAFTDGAVTNLQNKEGFPVVPFRTDNLQGWTAAIYVDMPFPLTSAINTLASNALKVYPNPFCDFLNLNLSNISAKSIIVKDVTGKTVLVQSMEGQSQLQINTRELQQGIYFLHLISDKGVANAVKIIKK